MNINKTVLLISALLVLSSCSEQQSATSHLDKAKNYINENKINESIIELKNAIRLDVKNSEARFVLGKAYLNQGDGVGAVKELERALQLKYHHELLIPLLARSYILTNADNDVIALADNKQNLTGEALAQYLAYKTLAAIRSEKVDIAKASVQQAKLIAPKGQYSLLAQAYLLFSQNKFEEARVIVKKILAVDINNADTLMLQGKIATAIKDYPLAANSFKHYLTQQPKSNIVKFLLADALLKSEQYDAAEKYADDILSQLSNQPFANYIKAMVRFHQKDFAKASEHAEMALSGDFNSLDVKLVAGASAYYLKNWEQANIHLSTIAQYLPPEHQAKKMLAVSQFELGLIDDINETLGQFSSENRVDSQFVASLSYKLLKLGAVDEARALIDKDNNNNTDAAATARQGVLKLMMNDPSGIEYLENAIKMDPELEEAELMLAYAAANSGDIEQAKKIASKWQEKHPDKAATYNLLATIYLKEKAYTKAENALTESLRLEKNNMFALTEQIRSAYTQEKKELAKERATQLIALYPDNEKAQKIYFDLYRNNEALELILSSYQKDKTNLRKALLSSEVLLRMKKNEQAFEILQSIKQNGKLPKRYWQLLLVLYKQQLKDDKILATLEGWRKFSPHHKEPFILLVDYYANHNDDARALNIVNQALEYHVDNVTFQLIKMQLLLNTQALYQAKALYNELQKRDIPMPLLTGMEGRLLLLEKKYALAIPKLKDFYQAYPSPKNVIYLAAAYKENGEENKAIKVLETALAKDNNDRISAILAGLYLKTDKDKSIQKYEILSLTQPNNIVVNNNLAWLYKEKGDFNKALIFAEKAFADSPEIANVVDTYSQVLLKLNKKRDALTQSKTAYALSKEKDIDIALNYIEVLIANNRMNEARNLLKNLEINTKEQKTKKVHLTQLLN